MLYCIAYHHNSDIALYCLILRSELYYTLSLDCIVLMEKLEFRSEIHWRDFDYISDTISQIQRSFQPVQCNFTLTWMYGCVNVFERTQAQPKIHPHTSGNWVFSGVVQWSTLPGQTEGKNAKFSQTPFDHKIEF